ncbi:hypothetical protein CA51_08430 [Rosistilla oblonga]|nr:hypothetical protein CA51_08430 [Rosistilla oblonga]
MPRRARIADGRLSLRESAPHAPHFRGAKGDHGDTRTTLLRVLLWDAIPLRFVSRWGLGRWAGQDVIKDGSQEDPEEGHA